MIGPFAIANTAVIFASLGGVPLWVIVGGGIVLLVAILTFLFPYHALVRIPLWILSRLFYRITTQGLENIPATGPALLVANHLSHIDAPLVMARVKRTIRFLIWADYLSVGWLKPLLRVTRVIPIRATDGPRAIMQSLRTAGEALANGDLVCIFAEGGISRTGFVLPFQRGLERIVKKHPAPIIPVYVDHIWGSVFSFRGGRFFWKWPREWRRSINIMYGKPLPPETPAELVRKEVQHLSAESAILRRDGLVPVHRQFVRTACRNLFRSCFVDPMNEKKPILKYGEALAGLKLLVRRLKPLLDDEEMVGLWIPPSTGGALANIAVAFLGKVSVNLNYSASDQVVQSAIRQCNIKKVITSRLFTKRVALNPGPGVDVIYLEDFRKEIGAWERLRTYLGVVLTPRFIQEYWILKLGGHTGKDLLTIIFSSGSTGEPKGIMLTHGNIAANAESVIQAIDPGVNDRLLGILPFFHSFGYTVTLWVPLQVGTSAIYYPNPLAAKEIGEACKKFSATLFVSSPTFLRSYLKRCQSDDFKSLRVLVCGAEKLPRPLAEEFQEKFGIEPLEGYGCTELSPVAAANVPNWESEDWKEIANKPGTIGKPLPGVAAKIVDLETMQERSFDEEGMLLVRGANVMLGYLNRDDLTNEKIHDGWYITGDLGKIDADGFITITGRVERFAKVGGEMVPLERVEEEIHRIMDTNERMCAVTAIADERKGERLIVLHLNSGTKDAGAIRKELSERGLPNIYIPGLRDFLEVEELPILGSGKLDIKKCKETALELAGTNKMQA